MNLEGGVRSASMSSRPCDTPESSPAGAAEQPDEVLSAGDIVDSRFEIVRLIGRGVMGAVYEAAERDADRSVALRLVPPSVLPDESARKRFIVRAKAAVTLQHEHIAATYGVGRDGDTVYVAMELLDGPDLASWRMGKGGAAGVRSACDILSQVCEAVAYAHGKGVTHLRLNPGAVLVTQRDHVKVIGFGLPADMGRAPDTADARACVAPEMRGGSGEADGRADVYSMGVMLYELVTGDLPAGDRPRPSDADLCLPEQLDELVENCLTESPDERISSADELRDLLRVLNDALRRLCKKQTAIMAAIPRTQLMARVSEDDETRLVDSKVGVLPDDMAKEGWGAEEARAVSVATPGGVVERDMYCYVNTVGVRFVRVRSGGFDMGSPAGERGRCFNEGPVRDVRIWRNVYMSERPITQRQYEAVTGGAPSAFPGEDRPVENVTWRQASDFCRRLSRKEALDYRLPTEAEWEYACRAGAAAPYYWGREFREDCAWALGAPDEGPHPAGEKLPNAFGLYDMSGNVWEWCRDWFDERYYAAGFRLDPKGPAKGRYRVIRGGSWLSHPRLLRSATREGVSPESAHPTRGFRIVCVCSLQAGRDFF